MDRIPFNDVRALNRTVEGALHAAFERVFAGHEFILGRETTQFEAAWSRMLEAPHAVGCSNGTDALILTLRALGVSQGDEVITTPLTFFATTEAILSVGARPVFVDVLPESGLIDPAGIGPAITPRTKAILVVHLYGQPAAIDEILPLARKHGISCLEDAAQAQGVRYRGRMLGTWGDAGCFSFFPGKNLGALGDAGAVVTGNPDLAEKLRSLRDHGRSGKYEHRLLGSNMRMDGLQAAFLSAKLDCLERWNANRAAVARIYQDALTGIAGLRLLPGENLNAPHLYVIRHSRRDHLAERLLQYEVETGVHYPIPCHRQPAWLLLHGESSFPVAEEFSNTCLSLPLSGIMTEAQAREVVSRVRASL